MVFDICRARKTFAKHVKPILEAAGFQLDFRETRGPGHATEIVKEAHLETVDAVVAVGGDGTIFEILQVSGQYHLASPNADFKVARR